MAADLAEPEFVAHLFAPLTGPEAGAALDQIRAVWDRCRTTLGMTQPILEAELSNVLPADPAAAPEGALCGQQDPTADFQAVARREHDVLNLSVAFAAPEGAPVRRRGIAAATPPGWHEFARWARLITATGTGALLGQAMIYLAKVADAADADVRGALPAGDDDGTQWWTRGTTLQGFAFWEVTPRGMGAARRMVLLARPDEDVPVSQFAWSSGGTELPPFGRYLMHAAKLRYLGRVRDGTDLSRVRDRTAATLDRLAELVPQPGSAPQDAALGGDLEADRSSLARTREAVQRMQLGVGIARTNLGRALATPLDSDLAIGDWLAEQLTADEGYLAAIHQRTADPGTPHGTGPGTRSARPEPTRTPPLTGQVEHRIGFGVDAIGYSSRSTPAQSALQERIAGMVGRVLAGIGVELHDTDRQPAGDGLMVVLPPERQAHLVLPGLLHGWRSELVTDNGRHPEDRIRLRLSVGSGPFTVGALGFAGRTIIEVGRLLDSDELRAASVAHPDADVVILVAGQIYRDVVGEGYPGLDPAQFTVQPVRKKEYDGSPWLWTGGDRPAGC